MLEEAAGRGATVSFEQNKKGVLKVATWIRENSVRRDLFNVYEIDAFKYGIPTDRKRCIFTNFPMPGEENLAAPDDLAEVSMDEEGEVGNETVGVEGVAAAPGAAGGEAVDAEGSGQVCRNVSNCNLHCGYSLPPSDTHRFAPNAAGWRLS